MAVLNRMRPSRVWTGDSPLGSMFFQAPARFHDDQHQAEIGIFSERLRRMSGLPAPFGSELFDLAVKVQRKETPG